MANIWKSCSVWHMLLVVVQIPFCKSEGAVWNYEASDDAGPEKWGKMYPNCGGVMQSPINIVKQEAVFDAKLEHFDFSEYDNTDGVEMLLANVHGHTAQVTLSGKAIYLNRGSLPNKYKLEQFHFHWGHSNEEGSEHSIDGVHYPMEVHFVHSQFGLQDLSAAVSHPHGLAVVGFFFQIGKKNEKYDPVINYLKNITQPDHNTSIPAFPISDLLPEEKSANYFRYQGSLTTPPCYESVIWSVSTDTIVISEEQLNEFRDLLDDHSHKLVDDYRPIQKLNQRSVLSTIRHDLDCSLLTSMAPSIFHKTPQAAMAVIGMCLFILQFCF